MSGQNQWSVELEGKTGRVLITVPDTDASGNPAPLVRAFSYDEAQSLAQRIQEVSRSAEAMLGPLLYPVRFMTATELEAELERFRQLPPDKIITGTITADGLARILEARLKSWSIPGTALRVNDRLLLTPEALDWLRANPNLGYQWYMDDAFEWVQVAPQADVYTIPGQILLTHPRGAVVNFPVAIAEAMREAYLKRGMP